MWTWFWVHFASGLASWRLEFVLSTLCISKKTRMNSYCWLSKMYIVLSIDWKPFISNWVLPKYVHWKNLSLHKRVWTCHPLLLETRMLPQHQQDTSKRESQSETFSFLNYLSITLIKKYYICQKRFRHFFIIIKFLWILFYTKLTEATAVMVDLT